MSFFYIVAKLDQGFVALLQPSENGSAPGATSHSVSTTEKVRIKSLVEETRVAAVRAASASGHQANIHDISEVDTTDEDEDQEDNDGDDGGDLDSDSISLGIAKVYKRTLEILGDSLVSEVLSQHEGAITETSRDEMRDG